MKGPDKKISDDIIASLEDEKRLIQELIVLLEKELGYITSGDVELLEESLPDKQKILIRIADARKRIKLVEGESLGQARKLKHELSGLWTKATGLNDLSKNLVVKRLGEIDKQLEPFFSKAEKGYNRSGKKSKVLSRTIKAGA